MPWIRQTLGEAQIWFTYFAGELPFEFLFHSHWALGFYWGKTQFLFHMEMQPFISKYEFCCRLFQKPFFSPLRKSITLSFVAKLCPTLASPWTVACQAPLSMGFSRQDYSSGLPFPSPGHLPDPGIKPRSPALQTDSLPTEPPSLLFVFFF